MHKGAHINIYIVPLLSYINNINALILVSINSCELPALYKYYILFYQYNINKTSFSHKKPLFEFSNAVVSGYNKLWLPLAAKVTFMKTHASGESCQYSATGAARLTCVLHPGLTHLCSIDIFNKLNEHLITNI